MRAPDKVQALRILRRRGVPIETVIDVGVQYCTRELMDVFPDRHHLLFEPITDYHSHISRLYTKISHSLVPVAVGERDGAASMEVHTIGKRTKVPYSLLVDTPTDRPVSVVSLDGYLSRNPHPKPYLLKIDVDGHEMPILRGASQTLGDSSIVVIECPKANLTERVGFLEAAGFEIFDLVEPCYYDRTFSQCDAVMIRRELTKRLFADPADFDEARYEVFSLSQTSTPDGG